MATMEAVECASLKIPEAYLEDMRAALRREIKSDSDAVREQRGGGARRGPQQSGAVAR
jgi:hypothetical protein